MLPVEHLIAMSRRLDLILKGRNCKAKKKVEHASYPPINRV